MQLGPEIAQFQSQTAEIRAIYVFFCDSDKFETTTDCKYTYGCRTYIHLWSLVVSELSESQKNT